MRVVVTRPANDAQLWVQGLQAGGHDVLRLPLMVIGAAPDPAAVARCRLLLPQFQAVMFVSANAVTHFFASQAADSLANKTLIESFSAGKTRAWATGPGTVQALLAQGLVPQQIDSSAPHSAQFDSETLWQQVHAQIKPGQRVLIVRGAGTHPHENSGNGNGSGSGSGSGNGRDWLATQLSGVGAVVEFCAAYQRAKPAFTASQLLHIEQWISGDAAQSALWLFSSSESITNLVEALPGRSLRLARAICTHPRIALRARACGFGVVRESRPTLADVLASIESTA